MEGFGMMKLPLAIDPDEPCLIRDANGAMVTEIDSQGAMTMTIDAEVAAEIVAAVNQRAEMVALLRRAYEAFGPGVWGYNNAAITAITAFLAKEPTP
jgi:hypothetical protein